MTRREHDIVDIEGKLLKETALAFLIDAGGIREWVPKSETENNNAGSFSMPEWLAQDKGFI